MHREGNVMSPGLETIVDAGGCSPSALCDLAIMRRLCEQLVGDLKLQVVEKPQWHAFADPGGVTGLYLLSESHLACHTYPEFFLATFNLYCCRERVAWDWQHWLEQILGAKRVEIRIVVRGGQASIAKGTSPGIAATGSHDSPGSAFAREVSL